MKNKEKKRITIEEIMLNQAREIVISGIGTVLIKDPTKKDRIESRVEASKIGSWELLDEFEKSIEIQNRVALKMIIEPKITEEEYLNASDSVISKIIEVVSLEYSKRVAELGKERKKQLVNFLFQLVGKKELQKMIGKKA